MLAADVEHLARSQGEELSGRSRAAVDADLGRAADHRHVALAEAAQPGPAPRELERARPRRVPHHAVGQVERDRIGRAGSGDTDGGDAPPPPVLHDGPQTRRHDLEHRAGAGRQGPRRWHHRVGLDPVARAGDGEADTVARRQRGVGRGRRGEQGEAGASDQMPAAG